MPIVIRYWIYMLIMGLCAYASYRVLMFGSLGYESMNMINFMFLIAPWILLFASLKGWYRCIVWRRMNEAKFMPQALGRGQRHNPRKCYSPNILERGCIPLILLALAAILKEFSVSNIGLWIGLLIGTWLLFGTLFRKVS